MNCYFLLLGCLTTVGGDFPKSTVEMPIYGFIRKPNISKLVMQFDIPLFILRVLGEKVYNQSKEMYRCKPVRRRHFSIILDGIPTSERESLGCTGDEKISYPDYEAKVEMWERIAHEKRLMRKKRKQERN